MVNYHGAKITAISPGSIAAELELAAGDTLLRMNHQKIQDIIDYLLFSAEERLSLEVLKKTGETLVLEFEKAAEEPLGLVFADIVFDELRVCTNHCLFCFVHQLPAGQRASLYVQDDDYRLSFLQGSYITLTNLSDADWSRIEQQRLSPLYVSVHATDPQIRSRLLGTKQAGPIMAHLQRLAAAGITVHAQAVICPGINDGLVLERTITDLAGLWPQVASLAVVPVGLTDFRRHLYNLRGFAAGEAAQVIKTVTQFQVNYQAQWQTRFVFAADEWYILSGTEFPPEADYEDYPQLDNGVGLIRWFLSEFEEFFPNYWPKLQCFQINFVLITGESTRRLWQQVQTVFKQHVPGVDLEILPVKNGFLGDKVTVTGLLSGKDIQTAIANHVPARPGVYLIPQITLKQDEPCFLDGLSVVELKAQCYPKIVEIVPTRAKDWLAWLVSKGDVVPVGPFSNCHCGKA